MGRALQETLCRRCWQRGGSGAKCPLPLARLGGRGRLEQGEKHGECIPLLALSLHHVLLCRESCWEDLLPRRSLRQPDKLHCPGCEERFRIYERWREPNQTYLFGGVLFVKMTSFFVLINKGILTAPWPENATRWVQRVLCAVRSCEEQWGHFQSF